jgi:hypothetical protein
VAAAVLVAASYALSEKRHLFLIAIVCSAISIIATWTLMIFPSHWTVLIAHSCIILLVSFFSISILTYVLRSGRVTSDRIFAAICVFMLIGYAWAFLYAMIDELEPGAFVSINGVRPADYVSRVMQLRYFSFITLTTTGYGDIVPRSPLARTFAMLEAVMGQFYLAVLVARLVGLHIVHATRSESSAE